MEGRLNSEPLKNDPLSGNVDVMRESLIRTIANGFVTGVCIFRYRPSKKAEKWAASSCPPPGETVFTVAAALLCGSCYSVRFWVLVVREVLGNVGLKGMS
ncbi:MAG: hypothetical protein JJ855_15500 [Rhodospirillales bacterium]|nr:hypothetical protein [Rhodospirillales bacterium]